MSDASTKAAPETLLCSVDDGELAEVKVPSAEAIREALERSREQYRKALSAPRPAAVDPRLRYR